MSRRIKHKEVLILFYLCILNMMTGEEDPQGKQIPCTDANLDKNSNQDYKTSYICTPDSTRLDMQIEVSMFRMTDLYITNKKISFSRSEGLDTDIDISLPTDLFSRVSKNVSVAKISFSVSKVNSSVLNNVTFGIEVANVTISNLTTPFAMSFSHKSELKGKKLACVFLNKNGQWDTDGCITESSLNTTTCYCNHFAFFAVLVTPYSQVGEDHARVLNYLTYVGCMTSAAFCIIALLTHHLQHLRESTDQAMIIHLHLVYALLLLNVAFLCSVGVGSLGQPRLAGLCHALALTLHYALLCCLTWMGLEAVHLYRLIIKVFNIYTRHYLLKLSLLGWGAPAVVVIIIVSIDQKTYHLINTGTGTMCWLNSPPVFYSTVVSYLGLVLLFNATVFIIVVVRMVHMQTLMTAQEKGLKCKKTCSVLGLTCIMGLTWGLGFFNLGYVNLPVLYVFTILNSLQGFFLFLRISVKRFHSTQRNAGRTVSRTDPITDAVQNTSPFS